MDPLAQVGWNMRQPEIDNLVRLMKHSYWRHIARYAAHPDPDDGVEPCVDCQEILRIVGDQ